MGQIVRGNNGPGEEDLIGLDQEDRKRRRSGHSSKTVMDITDRLVSGIMSNKGNTQHEAVISNLDCSASHIDMAKLAEQASRPL